MLKCRPMHPFRQLLEILMVVAVLGILGTEFFSLRNESAFNKEWREHETQVMSNTRQIVEVTRGLLLQVNAANCQRQADLMLLLQSLPDMDGREK